MTLDHEGDPADYIARHDPHFAEAVINDLIDHRGEWRHFSDIFGELDDWPRMIMRTARHEAVEIGRRLGMVIEGDARLGYRYVRWQRPPRYLRTKRLRLEIEALDERCARGEGGSDGD